jgi:hypothetical protein
MLTKFINSYKNRRALWLVRKKVRKENNKEVIKMIFDEMDLNEIIVEEVEEFEGDFTVGPLEHSIDEAIEGTLEEDKDVIFDEISE